MIQIPEKIASQHLQDSFSKGDVLFWKNFPIQAKEKTHDSYFILLTGCIDDQFIVARATKRVEYYIGPTAKRLNHDFIYIKKTETTIFSKDTIIDLTWIEHFMVKDLSKILGLYILKKGTLPVNIIQRINNAIQIAVTISAGDRKLILSS